MFSRLLVMIILCSPLLMKGTYGIHFSEEGKNITLESHDIEELILVCPYQLRNGDKRGLVVSWYYNDLPYPIFQWIPPFPPQALGFLKNYIDLSYESSNEESYRFSSLRILSPPANIAGKYICKVSSFEHEKRFTIDLVVFSYPEIFLLDVERRSLDTVSLKCAVGSVYPQPILSLYRNFQNKRISLSNSSLQTTWSRGAYNVSLEAEVKDNQLDGMTEFQCHLGIPNTNISMRKIMKYIPSVSPSHIHMYYGSSSERKSFLWLLIFLGTFVNIIRFNRC